MPVGNLVFQITSSTGTGDLTLFDLANIAPASYYRNFSVVFGTGVANKFYYAVRHSTAAEFEVGEGYMSSSVNMVRTAVIESSNADALVSFSAGNKDVICDLPANRHYDLNGTGAGQTLVGGADSGANLTIQSTAHATRGLVLVSDGLKTASGRITNKTRVTADTTLTAAHHHVFANTDSGGVVITLPAGIVGSEYRVINTGSSSNTVTITPDGAEGLLGKNSSFAILDGEALLVVFDTTDGWY